MTTRMLIDARHREETRVAVVKGNQIEELDFESSDHQQLKGNIYLAKVTRVEPSLQAAFVDFGGNRHGFLAFSEIHPDYYQIPKEDRERLLAEEQEAAAEEAEAREAEEDAGDMSSAPSDDALEDDEADENADELVEVDTDTSIDTIDQAEGEMPDDDDKSGGSDNDDSADSDGRSRRGRSRRGRNGKSGGSGRSASKRSDNARAKRIALRRRYKIQDVIHRRQVMLVQVVKEERGNKGAALTTYLSLAGRYCVLMPNTSHGGGISRKISSASDRKRLKTIVAEMKLPATMGCIIRTAGLQRTKTEIKRDFDYLARLWDDIREQTLKAAAPQLIHTDSDLVKRAIRDIYNRDIEEVMVEGEDGYRAAKDFMKLLMPSHARRVKQYADPVPLFQRYGVEDQLSAMYHPIVQLKSGGYIVINPTEALVSIDINSGRSTKEHGIEQTALSTNLEAAREISRQLRLRDMAGLVVIDFIDMENHSNSRKVERAMKDALKHDRARIQVGKISSFGLMEMSRQRLRTGVLEASTRECPHCEGTGLVRTASSSALSALRLLEEEAAKGKGSRVTLSASQEAAVYVLNSKRTELAEIEQRYGVTVEILPNGDSQGAKMEVSSTGPRPEKKVAFAVIQDSDENDDAPDDSESNDDRSDSDDRSGNDDGDGSSRRKGRRRGRRGGRGKRKGGNRSQNDQASNDEDSGSDEQRTDEVEANASTDPSGTTETADSETDAAPKGKRRPSRRSRKSVDEADQIDAKVEGNETPAEDKSSSADASTAEEGEPKPKRRRSRAKKAVDNKAVDNKAPGEDTSNATADSVTSAASADDAASDNGTDEKAAPEKPKRRPRARKAAAKSDGDKAKAASKSAKSDAAEAESAGESPAAAKEQPAASATSKDADASGEDYTMASSPNKQAEAASSSAPSDGTTNTDTESADGNQSDEDQGPVRKGWWQRTFGN